MTEQPSFAEKLRRVATGFATRANQSPLREVAKRNRFRAKSEKEIAPGVTYRSFFIGNASPNDFYTVDAGFFRRYRSAQKLVEELADARYHGTIETVNVRPQDARLRRPLGYRVQIGAYADANAARNFARKLAISGFSGLSVVHTGRYGQPSTGPWAVFVLTVNPGRFSGSVGPALSVRHKFPTLETVSSIAARNGAIAAVNGGYYTYVVQSGTSGIPTGVSVVNGSLISEATNGRTSLILDKGHAKIVPLYTKQFVFAGDGSFRLIDGLNRKPGVILNCGGTPGGLPTTLPRHQFNCTNPNELVLYSSVFGTNTEAGTGIEVTLDENFEVVSISEKLGGSIPRHGFVLQGIGDASDWLREHSQLQGKMEISQHVFSCEEEFRLGGSLGIVNGGPRLVHRGRVDIRANTEGFYDENEPTLYYDFGVCRNSRTLAGVTADGRLLLVVVDGDQPGYSLGLSFEESAKLMRDLGAVEAVNLDGGRSSVMTIRGDVVNRPSTGNGERSVAEAIVIKRGRGL
jgi:hypothetical protein